MTVLRSAALVLMAAGLVGCGSTQAAAPVTSSSVPSPTTSAPVSSAPVKPTTFILTGSFTLLKVAEPVYPSPDAGADNSGHACHGVDGYSDIADDTAVTVYDGSGSIVGLGSIHTSSFKQGPYKHQDDLVALGDCVFTVTVADVPTTPAFFQVEISHRGKLTVPAAEALTNGMAATLGS